LGNSYGRRLFGIGPELAERPEEIIYVAGYGNAGHAAGTVLLHNIFVRDGLAEVLGIGARRIVRISQKLAGIGIRLIDKRHEVTVGIQQRTYTCLVKNIFLESVGIRSGIGDTVFLEVVHQSFPCLQPAELAEYR